MDTVFDLLDAPRTATRSIPMPRTEEAGRTGGLRTTGSPGICGLPQT
jgi:hypothetical protein